MGAGLLIALLSLPNATSAESATWFVLPIHAEHPPPSDPTLLRTSERIGRAIADGVSARVRLVSRAIRDEHCTDDGHHCPDAIARILDAKRVIALELSDDLDRLTAYVYRQPAVMEAKIEVACKWDGGPQCAIDELVEKIQATERVTFDPDALASAWATLRPRIDKCLAGVKPNSDAEVTFRIQRDGRPADVRIEPRTLQRKRAYKCIARVVESLRVPPFAEDPPAPIRRQLHVP